MFETISVDDAISRGHRMVNYPVIGIMFACWAISIFLAVQKFLPMWTIAIGILAGVAAGWLYWSYLISKWRIWAFENVRNVHELKKRAIQEKLIWPDTSLFARTEIMNATAKDKWSMLQEKFKKEDIFIEDFTVPRETIIYYSKGKIYFTLTLMAITVTFGLYAIFKFEYYLIGIILSSIGLFFGYTTFLKALNRHPQITINDKGLGTISAGFYAWNNISGEEVLMKGAGKDVQHYLMFEYPGGIERIQIDEFDTNMKKLNKLLILYRGRFNHHR